jgi:hypothetical protein
MWPSDTEREKVRLDGLMRTTDAVVQTCGALTADERMGWAQFFAGWREFAQKEVGIFSANECALTMQYGRDLAGWRATIQTRCAVPGPDPTSPANRPPDEAPAVVKWAVVGVVALSAALLVRSVLR